MTEVDGELAWARAAWAGYAELDGGGCWPGRVRLEVSPSSRLCPPGAAGFVVPGDAALVIAVAARLGFLTCGSQLSIWPSGLSSLGRNVRGGG